MWRHRSCRSITNSSIDHQALLNATPIATLAPIRVSRQRRYDAEVIGRVRLLQFAREAGFSIAETRTFVAGFSTTMRPAIRWRTLAARKLEEIEQQMRRLRHMKALLRSGFHCQCLSIEDCAKIIGRELSLGEASVRES